MEENHSATSIYGAAGAPYINNTLMPMGAHVSNYLTHVHPSEPNYIYIEAGDNLGATNDNDPVPSNEQTTTSHLVSQLVAANLTWKAYVEDIDGKSCPLTSTGAFAVKHTPQLFFKDVTDNFSASSATCMAHVRPYTELATDLTNGTVAAFNFITPNLCDDMHGGVFQCLTAGVPEGDTWLKNNVPAILASSAFKNGGLLLIVWDEGDEPLFQMASDGPLPMLAIGSMVKTNYAGSVGYTHASMTKSLEEIFGVPLLNHAMDATTNDLADLFTQFP
jgi:phospholipase C